MTKEAKRKYLGSIHSRQLSQSFRIDNILSIDIVKDSDYKPSNCWEVMNCPEEIRKKCWAYRLNLGKECWILCKKSNKKFNWKNNMDYFRCEFYDYISKCVIK